MMVPEQNNPKYQDIFNTGKTLFWKHGIKRISVEEICREASVSKMTFYKFFPNKIELAKAILDDLMQQSMDKFEALTQSNMPFREMLKAIFLLKIEATKDFSPEFVNDVYTNPKLGLQEHLQHYVDETQDKIKSFYMEAQAKGHIRPDVKIDFIMTSSLLIKQYMLDEKLMAQYPSPKDFILEAMNMIFYGIVTRDA